MSVHNESIDKRLAAMYALLGATNEALLYATSLQELYQRVCDAAVDVYGYASSAMAIPDGATGWLKFEAVSGAGKTLLKEVFISVDENTPEGRGIVGEAFRSKRPAISNDHQADERTRPWHAIAKKAGIASCAAIPIIQNSRAIGVLIFYSTELNAFNVEQISLLERMGKNIVFAISNFEREDERSKTNTALRESEARFRAMTNLSSDWYWEVDTEFRFVRLESRRANEDHRPNQLLGRHMWESKLEVQEHGGWKVFCEKLQQHIMFRDVVMERVSPNSHPYVLSVSGEPMFDNNGEFLGFRGVAREITEQKVAEQHIQYMARHDELTGLPNRITFKNLLNLAITTASRYKRNFAVVFIDLDRFKFINDTLGHGAGDLMLNEITTRLQATLRSSDVIARLGGDEFVAILQEVSDNDQATTVGRKLLSAINKPMMLLNQECSITASMGIAMFPQNGSDEQTLMKNADSAMYAAKGEGKNNFQFYSEEINSLSMERLALEGHLRRALERNEFSLNYQAKIDLKSNAITGVEALLRWKNAELGMVSPVKFIPIAEETGLIVSIGRWVLETACQQNVAWQRQGLPPINMAVNLSAGQFADENLVQDIADILRNTGMDPCFLELEITEGMLIHNIDRAIQLLTTIKKMGIHLAIDDFGTGYSSLGQLKNFPIDTLKVDRSFIRDLATDSDDKAITSAIIAMGKTLSLTVVAEGVETIEQQSFLRDQACDEMQGYYFSKPIAADDFAVLLKSHSDGMHKKRN